MRVKPGSSVEVLRREKGPCCSWFPGRMSYVDGNLYIVRYELFKDSRGEAVVERVHGGDFRPCPPHEKGVRWIVGDLVEVFDVHCWRAGRVKKALSRSCFAVELFGSVKVGEFHESDMRVQQVWHNNKWLVIEKNGQTRKIINSSSQSWSLVVQEPFKPTCRKPHFRHDHGKIDLTARTTKRGLPNFTEQPYKDRVFRVNPKKRRLIPNNEKVHYFPIPRRSAKTEYSNECSVASCSVNKHDSYKPMENPSDGSDAESSFPSLYSKQHFPRHLKPDIHELELHAYNSTVEALYASGPLSWEQETLLTDLRFSLHISNEEHLMQLRNLLSAAVL